MKKIRDEQKGIIFIALIILVIAVVSVIFGVSLKSDFVKETLKDNQIVRVLFVVEDSDSSVLFSRPTFQYRACNTLTISVYSV